jgi:hypothetical protein
MYYLILPIEIQMVDLAAVGTPVRSQKHLDTPIQELRNTPLGDHHSEMLELEGREPTINTPLQRFRHSSGIQVNERCWLEEY